MSLRALIQKSVVQGFAALGDLPVSVIYRPKATAYDPETGLLIAPVSVTTTAVEIGFSVGERAATVVEVGDRQFMMTYAALTSAPEVGGTLQVGEVVYQIKNVITDPAGATYTLHLRR